MVTNEPFDKDDILAGLQAAYGPTELSQEVRNSIRGVYALYREYVEVGFTEAQALQLIVATLGMAAQGGQG